MPSRAFATGMFIAPSQASEKWIVFPLTSWPASRWFRWLTFIALLLSFCNLLLAFASRGCVPLFHPLLFVAAAVPAYVGFWWGVSGWNQGDRPVVVGNASAGLVLACSIVLWSRVGKPGGYEAQAIADSRSVIEAQQTYASVNGSFYEGRFECLSQPQLCLPEYPSSAPVFLGPDLARPGVKAGYERRFHPGPSLKEPNENALSTSSVVSFAYVAVPATKYVEGRSFCADSTGLICFAPKGKTPTVEDGLCGKCKPLP